MTGTLATKRKRRSGWWILRHFAGALLLVVCVGALGVQLVVNNLDADIVKGRLHALVQSRAGLELDYESAEAGIFSGLALENLVVASPPAYREIAPVLLRAEHIRLGWSLFGRGPTLQKITARDLELTVVVDERGNSSLDSLGGGGAQSGAPEKVSPGRQLQALVAQLPEFDRVALTRLSVTLLRTREGRVVERARAVGLGGHFVSSGKGVARRMEVEIGQSDAPLGIGVTDDEGARHDAGAGRLWLTLKLDGANAELHARASIERQSFSAAWPHVGELFTVDGSAHAEGDRLRLALDRGELVGRAAILHGAIVLTPGRALIERAAGSFDLGRLAPLVPRGPLAITCREGHFNWHATGLEISERPRFEAGGALDLEGRAEALRLKWAGLRVDLDDGRLSLKAHPVAGDGVQVTVAAPAEGARFLAGETHFELSALRTNLDATLPANGPGRAEARARFGALSATVTAGSAHATDGDFNVHLSELQIDQAHPLASSAAFAISAAIGSLTGDAARLAVAADNLRLSSHGRVSDGEPGAIELDLPLGRLAVSRRGGAVLLPSGPAHLTARIDHILVDAARPLASTGDGHLELALGPIDLKTNLHKRSDAADFDLAIVAGRTTLFTALAPASLALPGATMAVSLKSAGRVEGLAGSPRLTQHLVAHLDRPSVTLSDSVLAADALDVSLDTHGGALAGDALLTVRPRALALDDDRLGGGQLSVSTKWDADRPAIDLVVDGEGEALPSGHLALSAAWNRAARTLAYRVDGQLRHLAALEPILPTSLTDDHWIDLTDVEAKISGQGEIGGLLLSIVRGVPLLSPHPIETLRGDASLAIDLAAVHYVDAAGVELKAPQVSFATKLHGLDGARTAHTELHIPRATLTVREHKLVLTDLTDQLDSTSEGDPRTGLFEATHTFRLGRLEQDFLPLYPVAGVAFDTHGRRTADGALRLDSLTFENQAGGTKVRVEGALVLPQPLVRGQTRAPTALVGFKSLGLTLGFEQRLDALSGEPARFTGSGTFRLDGRVDSGDLHRFHSVATASFTNANFEFPAGHVRVAGLDGQLPITEDIELRAGHATLVPGPNLNTYPQLRFSDQHPFLSAGGALRVERVTVGDLVVDQIAGSLRVVRNLFAVDQLEAEVRGGHVAGQCVIDWRGLDSTVQLHVRATGVESTHGGARERFDGNAALSLAVGTRTLDGRAEILRIGRHHLYDLLDEYDPHHKDVATNRVRTALSLGYPDRVRLLFDRGFASFEVAFGGLGRFVHVGEVRGISTGPLVERYLAPLLATESK